MGEEGRIALVGDLHANKEALDAVLRNIASRNDAGKSKKITRILCTGDIVGYGPDPRHVLKTVYDGDKAGLWTVVAGNHDLITAKVLAEPEYPVGPQTGIKAPGGYEGIYLAARNLCGDTTPIPPKPPKPSDLEETAITKQHKDANLEDTAIIEQYKDRIRSWKKKEVEPYTKEVVKRVKSPEYAEQPINSLLEKLPLNSSLKVSVGQRLTGKNSAISRGVLEWVLKNADLKMMHDQIGEILYQKEGEALRNYLSQLPTQRILEFPHGKVLLIHDNPFNPGDSRYVLPGKSKQYTVDDVMNTWPTKWKDIKYIFFGHSHIQGIYSDKEGRFLVNPGSVGMPRGQTREATYVIWDPSIEGKGAFERVRTKKAGWLTTQEKMAKYGLPDKFPDEHAHTEAV